MLSGGSAVRRNCVAQPEATVAGNCTGAGRWLTPSAAKVPSLGSVKLNPKQPPGGQSRSLTAQVPQAWTLRAIRPGSASTRGSVAERLLSQVLVLSFHEQKLCGSQRPLGPVSASSPATGERSMVTLSTPFASTVAPVIGEGPVPAENLVGIPAMSPRT